MGERRNWPEDLPERELPLDRWRELSATVSESEIEVPALDAEVQAAGARGRVRVGELNPWVLGPALACLFFNAAVVIMVDESSKIWGIGAATLVTLSALAVMTVANKRDAEDRSRRKSSSKPRRLGGSPGSARSPPAAER